MDLLSKINRPELSISCYVFLVVLILCLLYIVYGCHESVATLVYCALIYWTIKNNDCGEPNYYETALNSELGRDMGGGGVDQWLRGLKSSNSKHYWNLLNSKNIKTSKNVPDINSFYEHFKFLNEESTYPEMQINNNTRSVFELKKYQKKKYYKL